MGKLNVVKRDGSKEVYDPEKIRKVVVAAGLNANQSQELVTKVSTYFKKVKLKEITSLQIRDRILVEIQKIDDYAAKKFIWWEKYKDVHFNK